MSRLSFECAVDLSLLTKSLLRQHTYIDFALTVLQLLQPSPAPSQSFKRCRTIGRYRGRRVGVRGRGLIEHCRTGMRERERERERESEREREREIERKPERKREREREREKQRERDRERERMREMR